MDRGEGAIIYRNVIHIGNVKNGKAKYRNVLHGNNNFVGKILRGKHFNREIVNQGKCGGDSRRWIVV